MVRKSTIFKLQSAILRAGDGIRTRGLLLGKQTLYHLTTPAISAKIENAESQNRTGDTAIFSRVLYQLSYLGVSLLTCSKARDILLAPGWIVKQHQGCVK